jgi:hypothetical protein
MAKAMISCFFMVFPFLLVMRHRLYCQGEASLSRVYLSGSRNTEVYLDFSPFSRSLYVIEIYTSKEQRLSFPRKIVASLCTNVFSTHACKEAALSTIKEPAK